MATAIRTGTPRDSDEILAVILDAFSVQPDDPRFGGHRWLAQNAPHEFRVMESDGRIVALLHIGNTWLQVGRCAVLKGDVGHVAVRSALQGQGLGSMLMRDTMAWLRDHGYHLSRLGGLMHFYARFGFEPFLRRFVEFEVMEMQGGKRRIPATEGFPEPICPSGGLLRPFDEARDWQARHEIHRAFYEGRSGAERPVPSRVPPQNPAPPDPNLLRFVYEEHGSVKGYLFAGDNPLEARVGETCFAISDFACLPDRLDAGALLIRQLLSRVARFAPARVISRLPFDEGLAIALQKAGVSFRRIELHQAVAGNMISVLSLPNTLSAVLPELSARLEASAVADWQGVIELALPTQSARLAVAGSRVHLNGDAASDCIVRMTQADFVKLLFGINGFAELPCATTASLDPRQLAVMSALFPRCQTGSGPWG